MTQGEFMAEQKMDPQGVAQCVLEDGHMPKVIKCTGDWDGTVCMRCGKRWTDPCNFEEDCK